ncbi:MAG: penicillin-binding transpeptidase domain-containing protein [Candidatus Taylorbacteria bacterium]|nr:penicillin-binding transpeptidase domain-containing protein [Candidatus Taylorbacteria bacterium]
MSPYWNKNKTYRISLESEDRVTPEETLLDSGSQYSDIEKPILGSIFQSFFIIAGIATFVLGAYFFKTAVIGHALFTDLAFQNKSANFPLPPPRGIITDKNGHLLVKNSPVFNLLAVTRELGKSEDFKKDLKKITEILGKNKEELEQVILEQMKTNSTFFVHLDLTKDQALAIKYMEPKGLYVIPDIRREYTSSNKISSVLGYTGKVSKEDLLEEYYFPTDIIGRLGVEAQYEKFLRGTHGNILFSREAESYVVKEPLPGKTVTLNLDYGLQIKLYDEIFAVLREFGLSKAAAIVQDPKTGAVLALASFPDFDNNIFSSGVSESSYKKLFENKGKPLFNRMISGLYNPGSTIKPYIGMTALQEHIVTPDNTVDDCINITVPNPYDQNNPYIFKNWRIEYGQFNLQKAIANSCNIYFFTVGGGNGKIKGLGAQKIADYLERGYANSKLGIDLPGESAGFIPTPDWKLREKGEPWYLGDTYNISIGQGDLLVTPLWLNTYISAIANGGSIYKPQVAQKITDNNKETIEIFHPKIIASIPFSQDVINEIKRGMRETVLSGTAQIMNELPVESAAKTGTAEVIKGKTINSLFTIFAPYDNPEIAMTILIEGSASNQGLAIRAAYNTLKWYFER